jgi:hypothetical protein
MTADLTPAQAARLDAIVAELSDIAIRLGETFGHEPSEVYTRDGATGRMCCGNCFVDWPCAPVRKIERVMVPVVHAVVADELRAAADWYWDDHGPGRMVHDDLKRRADALDPR